MDKIIEKFAAFQTWKLKAKQALFGERGDAVVWIVTIIISVIVAVIFYLGVAPGIQDAAEGMGDALGG